MNFKEGRLFGNFGRWVHPEDFFYLWQKLDDFDQNCHSASVGFVLIWKLSRKDRVCFLPPDLWNSFDMVKRFSYPSDVYKLFFTNYSATVNSKYNEIV